MKDIRDKQVAPVAAKGVSTPPDLTAISDPDAPVPITDEQEQQDEVNEDVR